MSMKESANFSRGGGSSPPGRTESDWTSMNNNVSYPINKHESPNVNSCLLIRRLFPVSQQAHMEIAPHIAFFKILTNF